MSGPNEADRLGQPIDLVRGRLTTHVLDTMHGRPASGVVIDVSRLDSDYSVAIARVVTNADGRLDAPILVGVTMVSGTYRLTFHIGDYFRAHGVVLPAPAFLEEVPVQFAISDPNAHYHVPLLVSPWAYSTYRGS